MEETKAIVAAPESADELIVIEQLPIIKQQLIDIKAKVDSTVEEVLSLDVTEETVKEIKNKRADLNKLATAFEEKRKAVKNAVLKPYEEFEEVYKECVINAFKRADEELKRRITVVEDDVRSRKQAEIEAYFAEYAANLNLDFVKFEDMNISAKISDSVKKLKEQVKATLDRIFGDAEMISTMPDADEIMAEYKKTFNASLAVTTVSNRHKAIEEEKRRAEERRAAEAARAEAAKKVEEAYIAQAKAEAAQEAQISPAVGFSAPTAQTPTESGNGAQEQPAERMEVYEATFTVRGTIEQLKEIKNFLNNGGFNYECQ